MGKDEKPPARSRHVLIVEDDDITRKLLVIEFKRRGHQVLEFADAAAAMTAVEKEKPRIDAAIVDLMNMGYGGNFGECLRQHNEYRSSKVIFYTALTQKQFDTRILNHPNTFYVHKIPGSINLLINWVEATV
ncbi:MAG: response regulator [Candidatus Omnitrophica bacterium]|nr:response regulator [Candidatus Omnitrophota bacterium]